MVFGFSAQILEYRLLPIPLHMVPIIDHTVSDRIVHSISRRFGIRKRLIADEEIQIFDPPFRGEVTGFGRNLGSSAGRLSNGPAARRDRSWEDTLSATWNRIR